MLERNLVYQGQRRRAHLEILSPRWRKVFRDLWGTKARTLMVVLSIAVGVFAFGMIAATQIVVDRELQRAFLATNPVSATITTDPFDEDLVEAVGRLPGVGAAEGQRSIAARVQTGPAQWYDLRLFVVPNDGDMQINIVRPNGNVWPPAQRTLLVDQGSLAPLHAEIGDQIQIETSNGLQRTLQLAGTTQDMSVMAAQDTGQAVGYVSFDTLEWLDVPRTYDQLQIVVAENPRDKAHIQHVATQVEDLLRRGGRSADVIEIPEPQRHPAQDMLPSVFLLLSLLSGLSLLIGGFLINNTIGAILTQQIRHIGIMKSIGARTTHIAALYLSMVLVYGILAVLLAVPLSMLCAGAFSRFLAGQVNFEIANFVMPWEVVLLQVAAGLLVPLLTALPAILSAARITVREAISTGGMGANSFGSGLIDRAIERIRGLPRPLMLSLRNTFRRKGRLITTLIALTLSGAIFCSVLTVHESLLLSLDDSIATKNYDIEVSLGRPYRFERLQAEVLRVPGVARVEGWQAAQVFPVLPNGNEGEEIYLNALPEGSTALDVQLREGRWLLPQDERALVISANILTKIPDIQLGDEIALKLADDTTASVWRIVGFYEEFGAPMNPAIGYVNDDAFVRAFGGIGEIDSLRITTTQHDAAFHAQAAQALESHLAAVDVNVQLIESTTADREVMIEQFGILTAILGLMAALIGLVGGLGLMGTMSINVLERTREIGVLRAIGASDSSVQQIVLAEGIVIGAIAWITGTLLSLPVSRLLSDSLGLMLLNTPLSYSYASVAVVVWLVLVIGLAVVASYLPARNAARITVRAALAHE